MSIGWTAHRPVDVDAELPLWRLNLMRVGYAVMGVGLAVVPWRHAWRRYVPAEGDRWRAAPA